MTPKVTCYQNRTTKQHPPQSLQHELKTQSSRVRKEETEKSKDRATKQSEKLHKALLCSYNLISFHLFIFPNGMSNKKFKLQKAFQYDHREDDDSHHRYCDENNSPQKSECRSQLTVLSNFYACIFFYWKFLYMYIFPDIKLYQICYPYPFSFYHTLLSTLTMNVLKATTDTIFYSQKEI